MTYVNGVPEFEGVHIYAIHGCQLKVMFGQEYAFYYKATEEFPLILGDCTARDGRGVVYSSHNEEGLKFCEITVSNGGRTVPVSLDADEFEMIPIRPRYIRTHGTFYPGSCLDYSLFSRLMSMNVLFTEASFFDMVSADVEIFFMSVQAMNSYISGFLSLMLKCDLITVVGLYYQVCLVDKTD